MCALPSPVHPVRLARFTPPPGSNLDGTVAPGACRSRGPALRGTCASAAPRVPCAPRALRLRTSRALTVACFEAPGKHAFALPRQLMWQPAHPAPPPATRSNHPQACTCGRAPTSIRPCSATSTRGTDFLRVTSCTTHAHMCMHVRHGIGRWPPYTHTHTHTHTHHFSSRRVFVSGAHTRRACIGCALCPDTVATAVRVAGWRHSLQPSTRPAPHRPAS